MKALMLRNLKVFFRDRAAVFFSLLAVFIIIGLYALFLGDAWSDSFAMLPNVRVIMDSWIMAGMLAVTSVTTTMGAFGTLVTDRSKHILKDFYAAPLRRRSIASGYIASAYTIGVIMSLVALVIMQIYMVLNGGSILPVDALLTVLGLILLCTLTNTAMVFFLVSLFRSENAFSTASTIIGTLIGFVTGIYLPVGVLPGAVQTIVKVFPVSHAVALFRQVMLAPVTADIPAQQLAEFQEMMGVTYKFGDTIVTPWGSIAILLGTALVFYLLAVWMMGRKKR